MSKESSPAMDQLHGAPNLTGPAQDTTYCLHCFYQACGCKYGHTGLRCFSSWSKFGGNVVTHTRQRPTRRMKASAQEKDKEAHELAFVVEPEVKITVREPIFRK